MKLLPTRPPTANPFRVLVDRESQLRPPRIDGSAWLSLFVCSRWTLASHKQTHRVPVKGEQRNRRKKEYQKEQIMVSCALCTRCNATVLIVVTVVVVIVIVVQVDVDVAILCTCSLCKIKILLNHSLSDRVNY